MDYKVKNGFELFTSPLLKDSGIIHGFTTRKIEGIDYPSFSNKIDDLDDSALDVFIEKMEMSDFQFVFQHQVHGDNVTSVQADKKDENPLIIGENDGLTTNSRGVCLVSLSADCLSLLLAHPKSGAIANAHCGRRGSLMKLPQKLVYQVCSENMIMPGELIAIMGTSISPVCYEVGEDVVDECRKNDPESLAFILRRESKRYFDLRGYIFHQLIASGVKPAMIDSQSKCSHCHEDLFYSYRRDGKIIGRMAGFIAARP